MTPDEMRALADEAEATAEGATPGPWVPGTFPDTVETDALGVPFRTIADLVEEVDVAFLIYSRSAVPQLAKALREAAEEIEQLRHQFAREGTSQ